MPDVFISEKNNNIPSRDLTSGQETKPHGSVHKLPGHSHNVFSAYSFHPDKVRFVNEDPQERVILLLRRHPITNLGWLLFAFLAIVAPAFLTVLPFFEFFPAGFKVLFILAWYLVTAAFVYVKFLGWFFHVNIVTDERIIEVDFVNLIYREITDANIDQIQDVTVEMGGGIRTYFNYGDLIIQTAAEIPKIDFEAVPKPDMVAKVLRELRVEEEQEKLEGRVR